MKKIALSLLISAQALTIGCFKMAPGASSLGSQQAAPPEATANYSFISVTTLRSILANQLGLTSTTTPACVNPDNGQSVDCTVLYASALGEGDPSKGIKTDHNISALKTKVATQIYADGCATSMENQAARQSLFPEGLAPNGKNSFDTIYLRVLGRAPATDEVTLLNGLVDDVSRVASAGTSIYAAVCTAVLSSIEALHE